MKFLLFSLVFALALYRATDAGWRRVADAELDSDDDSFVNDVEEGISTVDDCNTTCSDYMELCHSFAFSSDANDGDGGCIIYNTRFGFNDSYLVPSGNGYIYYDRPTDEVDDLGDQIGYRVSQTGYDSFLSWFRAGITGSVSIDETSSSDLEISVTYTGVDSVEDCAKLCLRGRGVIDETIGTRCDSFNWKDSGGECELLSVSWDDSHSLTDLQGSWTYYDRLQGDGCWITQSACRAYPSISGTFEVTTDEYSAGIAYEYQCMAQAKQYHENVCDGHVTNATVAYWGGTDGQGVYDSWNSWDFTTGCVVDLSGGCYPDSGNNNSRFHGKFRDSIAEEQFNAGNSVDACFERALAWKEYCNLGQSQTINISFPSTGAVYIYPLINCTCDEKGMKRDIATELEFCTRNNSDSDCWRPYQQDFWDYEDILCDDLDDGCPEYEEDDWPANSTRCWLQIECVNNEVESGLHPVPCPDDLLSDGGVCYEYSSDLCENATKSYHELCDNDIEDGFEQAVTFYLPTGEMFVYPDFELPQENTLISGIEPQIGYTKSDISDYTTVAIGTGRWMAVYNGGSKRTLRQITIWFKHDATVSLTMSLYKGEGVTGSVKLETTSVGEFGPSPDGEYIDFVVDNVDLDSEAWYTWQVTSTKGNNDDGFIGFGIDYSNGVGDLTWDYVFVMYVENAEKTEGTMKLIVSIPGEDRPWFETWFVIGLVLLGIWLIILIFFHFKRKREEAQERDEERQRQQEIKQRARQKAMARNDEDAEFYDEDDGNFQELDSDDEDEFNTQGRTTNKQAIIEEDDDDDVITTKGNKDELAHGTRA